MARLDVGLLDRPVFGCSEGEDDGEERGECVGEVGEDNERRFL